MKAVLLIAHGSKKARAKEEILDLTEELRERLAGKFDMVSAAFLERATPTTSEVIQEFINKGATEILIIPYLLATGRHVSVDIPEIAAGFFKTHPDIHIKVLPHIGTSGEMPILIQKHIETQSDKKYD